MLNYIWPLALIILSNVFYQLCAKSVPEAMNPFASLTITYIIGAVVAFILFFVSGKDTNLVQEYQKANWAPFVLGLSIVGLEVGFIYAFKAGWPVSTAQIVQAAIVAIILIFVGYALFHESITLTKVCGVIVCLIGLGLINLK